MDNLESANAEKEKLLQEAKHKSEKLDAEHKRDIENLKGRISELDKELNHLQVKKEEEREAATTSSIQLKVCWKLISSLDISIFGYILVLKAWKSL